MIFEKIIKDVIEHEGGYVDDPDDRGGETKYGISKKWYPELNIKDLTMEDAINIYYNDYWIPSKAESLPKEIRSTYFDMCVNMGQGQAVKILQEAINSKKTAKIEEDGVIGSITINSAVKVSKKRLQAYRCKFYANLVSMRPSQEKFYYGWFKRAIEV